jgi:glycosyltransferase involved in cell wall biosynthesis
MIYNISIIVPCYSQGQYLAEALESLLAQTYTHWECIIINDNSPDNTEQVANKYSRKDSRFKYIFTKGKGVSAARNKGISIASGTYILPLDADDKIAPTYIEKALTAFSHDPELTLVYGEAEYFGDMAGRWNLPEYRYYDLLFMNMIYCSAIFKREDFFNAGGYSNEMVHGHEDWDFWLRLLKGGAKVLKLPDVVFFYRKKLISRSTEVQREEYLERTQKQLLWRNKEIYNDHIYTILQDLERCKNEKTEVVRQLNLIKNSRIYKVISTLKFLRNIYQLS